MTFRLSDPAVKFDRAPVVRMTSGAGAREVLLAEADGQPGVWIWTNDAVRAERFDGSLQVVIAGHTYTTPLETVWEVDGPTDALLHPKHGGNIVPLTECGSNVEIVQDTAAGTLTIYPLDATPFVGTPSVTFVDPKVVGTVTVTEVDGQTGVWTARHVAFKVARTPSILHMHLGGKACDASIFGLVALHGGRVVVVEGGPTFEIVRDPKDGTYAFYALEDTYDGKPYAVDSPVVVVGGRTYELTRIEGTPRAWRLVGLAPAGVGPRDGRFTFKLQGVARTTEIDLAGTDRSAK